MLRFEWNALRVGDSVLVHDRDTAGLELLHGVVAMVDSERGSYDIGIRTFARDGTTSVCRPSRLGVHRDPHDPSDPCWQCELLHGATAAGAR